MSETATKPRTISIRVGTLLYFVFALISVGMVLWVTSETNYGHGRLTVAIFTALLAGIALGSDRTEDK